MLLNKMGLLNDIFPKEDIAKEISKDVEKRIKIWNEYLETYLKKEKLDRFIDGVKKAFAGNLVVRGEVFKAETWMLWAH